LCELNNWIFTFPRESQENQKKEKRAQCAFFDSPLWHEAQNIREINSFFLSEEIIA